MQDSNDLKVQDLLSNWIICYLLHFKCVYSCLLFFILQYKFTVMFLQRISPALKRSAIPQCC